eukprot:6184059-Pleurochrysis_carterae.AAC.2
MSCPCVVEIHPGLDHAYDALNCGDTDAAVLELTFKELKMDTRICIWQLGSCLSCRMSNASSPFWRMGNRMSILQNGRPFCRMVSSPLYA